MKRIILILAVVAIPVSGTAQDWIYDRARQESDGGGAGADAATDPSAILTQLQVRNVFAPESHNASGYANTAIVQPVLQKFKAPLAFLRGGSGCHHADSCCCE